MTFFRRLSRATAVLFASLFAALLLAPSALLSLVSISGGESADFVARRLAMLCLGLAVLAWLSRSVTDAQAGRAISAGVAVMMMAMAALGTVEFLRGFAGAGILASVLVEAAVGIGYVIGFRRFARHQGLPTAYARRTDLTM